MVVASVYKVLEVIEHVHVSAAASFDSQTDFAFGKIPFQRGRIQR